MRSPCFLLGLWAISCAPERPAVPKPEPPRALTNADVDSTLETLRVLRGWKPTRPIKVELLSRSAYARAAADVAGPDEPFDRREEALAALLGMIGPTATAKSRVASTGLNPDLTPGFFSTTRDVVYVLNEPPKDEDDSLALREVLAHELHHAIQHQRSPRPRASGDAALAFRAVQEGDARVAELLLTGASFQLPTARTLRRARYQLAGPRSPGHASTPTQRSPWETLPAASRRLAAFPYVDGLAFMIDMFRTGGFRLMDQVYERWPSTTEHILHPEKYLADEQPRAVGSIGAIEGWTLAWAPTIGELRTATVLERCHGSDLASATAAGWDGDRAFVLEGQNEWMLGWLSAWDTEADAAEAEQALQKMDNCLQANDAGGKLVAAGHEVRKQGTVVALARGGSAADRVAVIRELLAAPLTRAPSQPVSHLQVPPLRSPPRPAGGRVAAGVYRNDFLGLAAATPPGFELGIHTQAGLGIDMPEITNQAGSHGFIALDDRMTGPEHLPGRFERFRRALAEEWAVYGEPIVWYGPAETVQTGIGTAYQRSVTPKEGRVRATRRTIIPICGGAGAFLVTGNFSTTAGRDLLDHWLRTLRWLHPGRTPPVCEFLDPETTRADPPGAGQP